MEHQTFGGEVTFPHEAPGDDSIKRIRKTTIILSVLTLIELGLGLAIYMMHKNPDYSHSLVHLIKGVVIILSLGKAFFIVSIFMHLGDEIRNMIMTIVVPLCLFIWFIIAFLWDGVSWKDLRNEYAPKDPVKHEQVEQPAHEGGLK
ncbi:MAG: cytochrome C oxidase subunit IV family protein [Chitinophagaceae bacterium]|nr:cytochrome C oxidase subunit IV family protein [Chitinophagaceae bacterium]